MLLGAARHRAWAAAQVPQGILEMFQLWLCVLSPSDEGQSSSLMTPLKQQATVGPQLRVTADQGGEAEPSGVEAVTGER